MQRYEIHTTMPYQYLGGVEAYDVIWFPDLSRLILKYGHTNGCYYVWQESTARWVTNNGQRADYVSDEVTTVALAMRDCFAVRGDTDAAV